MTPHSKSHSQPGPRGAARRQSMRRLRRDPLTEYLALSRQYGDIIQLAKWPRPLYLVSHPDAIRHVLRDNARNYRKGIFFRSIAAIQGQGLLTSEGELWRRQRRLAQPAFHPKQLVGLGPILQDEAQSISQGWRHAARTGEPINVSDWMHRFTFRVVGRALLGLDPAVVDQVGQQLQAIAGPLMQHLASGKASRWAIPTAQQRRFRLAVAAYNEIVQQLIEARRQTLRADGAESADLLAHLIRVHDEAGGDGMTAQQLRDEVITLIGAGVETSAQALSWTWHLLAQHSDVTRQLQAELDVVLGTRPPTLADLPQLPYSRMILDETLRLYPPSALLPRQANAADRIGAYHIPRNAVIMMSQYVTHRHADFWPEPERFNPGRFDPTLTNVRHRFAYFPFGEGPRICIGKSLALMEMHVTLATLAQGYTLHGIPGREAHPELAATLRPRHGLWMTVRERC